ncbi:MAG: hypothetical protein DRP42_07280 [Tenericutes bacterium]|nr:MAG: hypothetical protein DRP42_07280 [Mycoplasmatota bacterium]
MKQLYGKKGEYTQEARDLHKEADDLIRPLFDKCVADGYSPRDVSHLIKAAIGDIELETVLGW